ncbi:MAG: DUF4160 domain-containing protein [Candidatus Eremiobacteraeota bacterium]|nr:DUF4160 domain-containing protein [Candidatus Eremiobacteraeota bacterium]
MAPTIFRREGFSVKVNTRDHLPPHVHVWKNGQEARFAVYTDRIELLSAVGMTDAQIRRAAEILYEERERIETELRKMPWTPST